MLIVTHDNDHLRGNLGEFFTQSQNSLLATRLFRLPNFTIHVLFQFLPRPALFEAFVIVGSPLNSSAWFFRSRSAWRCQISAGVLSIGLCDVPRPITILAMVKLAV